MSFPHPRGNERNRSYWIETTGQTSFPPVNEDQQADVLVVGAGIAGVTSAYLLARAGKSVIVVDRERAGMSETGHTTAHLQIVVDTPLRELVDRFGEKGAKLAWDSQLEAVELIEEIARREKISCELERLPAFLSSPDAKQTDALREQMRLARKFGYDAEWADPRDVPYDAAAAVRFPNQGKFHARKYVLGLVKACEKMGVRFFEGTECTDVAEGTPVTVKTRDGHTLSADWLVAATNTPWHIKIPLHTKMTAYRTYAVEFRVPRGVFGHALYWDTMDPYHYTRVEPQGEHDLVILGGEDHELAEDADTEKRFLALVRHMRQATDDFEVVHHWSGEVMETHDDLPYIGRAPGRPENELIITGDSGTGMTNGTIGALMVTERILGRGSPWDELYDPARAVTGMQRATALLTKAAGDALDLGKTLLKPGEIESVDELAPGQGGILRRGVSLYAVAKRMDGEVTALKANCSHAGCVVGWNHAEQSWDCPCHGGRFTPEGEILHGPPAKPLPRADLTDTAPKPARHRDEA